MSPRRDARRTKLGAFGSGLLLAVVIGAFAIPAMGQSSNASVAASPDAELVNQQYVDVSVSGQRPNYVVRIRECPHDATQVAQCKGDSQTLKEAGDQRLISVKPDGTGSTPFVVASGELVDANGSKFKCDRDNACEVDAFQLDDYGTEMGFSHASRGPVLFGASTVACPAGAKKSRISGSGATSPAANVVEWQSETCAAPYNLNVSYAITNSPNGKSAFIAGVTDSDYAISTVPLKTDEMDQLKAAKRDVVQIPITVGSLAFVYNYYEVVNRCNGNTVKSRITDLRLSPAVIIGILTGHITDMNDQRIADDNPELVSQFRTSDCQTVTRLPSRLIQPVGRADNSGATFTLSSWALANAKDAWEANGPGFSGGATEVFPAGNGVDLRTGNAAVARDVRSAGGTTDGPAETMWFGYVDSSVARQLGLPALAVKTSANSWVQPTSESVRSGLTAATLQDDGTVKPNYTPTDPKAYPLVTVSYLITDQARLSKPKANTMKAFAAYAVTKGQDAAELRGYIPLSDELKTSASTNVAKIGPAVRSHDGGGDGSGNGGGSGGTGSHLPGSASDGVGAGVASAGDGGGSSGDLVGSLLASTRNDGNLSAHDLAVLSPIRGGPFATQTLGPAGGPAGIVRALSVFLGVPMLLILGFLCLFLGSADKLMAFVRSAIPIRGRRVKWRAI